MMSDGRRLLATAVVAVLLGRDAGCAGAPSSSSSSWRITIGRDPPAAFAPPSAVAGEVPPPPAEPQEEEEVAAENGAAADHHHGDHHRHERGKLLPEEFDEEDMFRAYKEIEEEYEQKAFRSTRPWKVLSRRNGIEVALLEHPDDPTCPYIRMKAVIPVPVDDCWNFLRISEWNRTMPQMDPFFECCTVHGEYEYASAEGGDGRRRRSSVSMALCRKCTGHLLAFGKRDWVFLSVAENEPLGDGTRVSGTVSVRTGALPRRPGYTRAFQDSIAFYRPVGGGAGTELTIVCRIDLNDTGEDGRGGRIPMWLYVKTVGRTGAQSVARMRKALIQEQKQQRIVKQKSGKATSTTKDTSSQK